MTRRRHHHPTSAISDTHVPRFVQLNSSRTEIEWGDVKTRKVCALLSAPVPRAPSTSHPHPAPLQMTSSLPISECKRVLYGEPSETFKGFTFRPHEPTSYLHPAAHTALSTALTAPTTGSPSALTPTGSASRSKRRCDGLPPPPLPPLPLPPPPPPPPPTPSFLVCRDGRSTLPRSRTPRCAPGWWG